MQRKNDSFLPAIALICTIILSFQPLFAVYRSPGKRLAAGRQTSSAAPKPTSQAVAPAPEEEKIIPISAQKQLEEKNDAQVTQEVEQEEKQEEEAIEDQDKLPAPAGFFSKAYMLVTPLILVTLNAGVGVAIEAGTKSLIKSFSKRPLYLEKRAQAEERDTQLQLKLLEKYPEAIKQQKLDLIPEKELEPWIVNATLLEELDKSTSLSYIFSRAAYTFMIYTIFNTIAKITGYSASVTLDTLLQGISPTQPKIGKPKK